MHLRTLCLFTLLLACGTAAAPPVAPAPQGLLGPGLACAQASDCSSNYCVDGVCCNAPCNGGTCQACNAAKGASADGVCTTLPAGYSCGTAPFICGASPCVCEKPGVCDGTTAVCGPNTLYQSADMHVCSAANPSNNCSVTSYCDGSGPGCSVKYQPAGQSCNKTVAGNPMCGKCNASGVCLGPFAAGACP
jgi:hypothetical protein